MRSDGTTPSRRRRSGIAPTYGGKAQQPQLLRTRAKAREAISPTKHGIADFTDANMATPRRRRPCRENDAVVATPRAAFNVLCYGEKYPEQMSRMRYAHESGGGVYSQDANSQGQRLRTGGRGSCGWRAP